MFKRNMYLSEYWRIIKNNKLNPPSGYVEEHHIIPRSLGGTNYHGNLVKVTGSDHLKLHTLLPYFTSGNNRNKMLYAWNMMTNRVEIINYDEYEFLREEWSKVHSERMKGENNPMYGKIPLNAGCPKSEEIKKKISDSMKGKLAGEKNPMYGKKYTQETIQKIKDKHKNLKGEDHPSFGRKHTDEEIKKMKKSWENRPFIECPFCGLMSKSKSNMKRYHFDNCKYKN